MKNKIAENMTLYSETRPVEIKGYRYLLYGLSIIADNEDSSTYVLVENVNGELHIININLYDLKFIDNKLKDDILR